MDVATEHFSQCGQSMSVLVNNVGTNIRKPTVEYTAEEWDRIISTNLQSAFHLSQLAHPVYVSVHSCARALLPCIRPPRRPCHVYCCLLCHRVPACERAIERRVDVHVLQYGTVCVRVGRLKAAATERGLSSAVVNISSVSGGPTCTQTGSVYAATKAAMNHFTKYTACEWAPDGIRVNAIAPWYIRTPLAEGVLAHAEYADAVLSRTPARRVGEPSEVADALAYMASDAASYVSGTVLQVDGGFSASGFGFYDGFAIPAPKA
jgi:NAD(P)-dependent dehydrogenase (short-subunit alcohol dehydrogenase family)